MHRPVMPDPKHTRTQQHRTETAGRRRTPLTRRSRTHAFIIADQTPFRALIKARQPAFGVGAATGRHREPNRTHGHIPGMAPREGEDADREHIRQDLLLHARRLAQHARHLGAKERDELDQIVDRLSELHTDNAACANLRKRHSDLPAPPWGTRYASRWERAWWWLRRALASGK